MKYLILIIAILSLSSCAQEMRPITIHFAVDMTAIDNVSSVGVIGEYQPLSWDKAYPLADENKDGVYEVTVTIHAAYNYAEFKFMLNDSLIELTGRGNRSVDFTDVTTVAYSGRYDEN